MKLMPLDRAAAEGTAFSHLTLLVLYIIAEYEARPQPLSITVAADYSAEQLRRNQ